MKICRKYFCLIIVAGMLLLSGCDSSDYKKAVDLYVNGDYAEACIIFSALGEYEDSRNLVTSCRYHLAKADLEKGNYSEACSAFSELGDYEDCSELVTLCLYNLALEDMNNGEFLKAYDQFSQLGDYLDSAACLTKAKWGLLYQYVQENGAYSAKTGKNAISQKIKSSDSKADYTMYCNRRRAGAVDAVVSSRLAAQ